MLVACCKSRVSLHFPLSENAVRGREICCVYILEHGSAILAGEAATFSEEKLEVYMADVG